MPFATDDVSAVGAVGGVVSVAVAAEAARSGHGPLHVLLDLARAERAVVDAHLVDQAREPLTPDAVSAEPQRTRSTPPSSPTNGSEPACAPFTNNRTTAPSNVTARCDQAFNGNRRRPNRVPLRRRCPPDPTAAPRLHPHTARRRPAGTLLEHHRPPPTQPATAAPTPRPSSRTSGRASRISHRHPIVHTVEAQRRPEPAGRAPHRPRHRARRSPDPTNPRQPTPTPHPTHTPPPGRRGQRSGRTSRCRSSPSPASRTSGRPRRRRTRTGRPMTHPTRRSARARRRRSCTPAMTSASSARRTSSRRRRRCGRWGWSANVRLTFFGRTSRVTVVVTPAESVAVSWISR